MKLTLMNLTIELKDKIYDFLSENKIKFIYKKSFSDKVKYMNILINSISDIEFSDLNDCFEYLTSHWDKKCKNIKCNNKRKLITLFPNRNDYLNLNLKYGIYKFCDNPKCNYISISERQLGKNNSSLRMSKETFKKMCLTNSLKMKKNIKDGKFIPNITNSWAKSRCNIQFIRNGELIKIKTRSSWDAYFQLFNPNILYEKLIIQYFFNKIEYNYIVDFIDNNNKVIYEIKPNSNIDSPKNKAKIKYAKKWAKNNGFIFKLISDNWFVKNYNEELIIGQPDEEKMKRNLKQFL